MVEPALRRVASYFDANLSLEDLEDLFDSATSASADGSLPPADVKAIEALGPVHAARTHPTVLNDLLELCNECSNTEATFGETPSPPTSPTPSTTTSSARQAPPIGWKHLISTGAIVPDHLLAYFTCLVRLPQLRPTDPIDRRLGLLAARTYMRLLTVPGSQVYGIFHAPLVQEAVGNFALLAKLLKADGGGAPPLRKEHERIDLVMNCVALLEDFKQMLLVVSLAEHDDLKRALMRSMNGVLLHYFELVHRSKYSLQLYEQCFCIFDIICHPRHGDITATLFAVMRGTGRLKRFTGKVHTNNGTSKRPKYETISAWFAEKLSTLPSQAATVLTHYVKAILSNVTLSTGGPEVLQSNLDICVQYETALWRRGNTTLVEYLVEDLALFADIGQRTHAIEFAVRLLAVDSPMSGGMSEREQRELEWSREIGLLRMVLEKMLDISNSIKMKAMAGFMRLTTAGNQRVKDILRQVFMNAETNAPLSSADTRELSLSEQFRAIAISRPDSPTNSLHQAIKGIEQMYKYRTRLLVIIRHNLCSSSALVRKAAILLLEFMSKTDIVLDEFLLSREIRALHADTSPMVRRQLILTAEQVMSERPENKAAMEAYVRVTLDLATDDDPKVADTVAESFKRNLFDNIRPANVTMETERALFPWQLLRVMQSCNDVPDIRACIGGWVHKKLITRVILEHIVSHTQSTRALEAWNLLSMVASHITSREPGFVVEQLWKNIQTKDPHSIDIVYAQLEVLACWLDALDKAAQDEVHRIFEELLGDGCVSPCIVQRTFEICARIERKRSAGKSLSESEGHVAWAETVRQRCFAVVQPNMRSLLIPHVYDPQMISCVHVYAEAVTLLPEARPNDELAKFLLDFLRMVSTKKIKFTTDSMLTDKMNAVQIVLTKLSLFDYELCLETVPVLGRVLNSVNQPDVIITSIACLGDLYKKRTSLAETVLPLMLTKTRHLDHRVRCAALQKITGLVIDEFIKFRGSLLVFVLAALLDERPECSELAAELLYKYRAEKNPVLMRSCLLECPFVLNGYMHLDNMDNFNRSESSLRSPIMGVKHRQDRQYVYRFLVHSVDVLYCYMYFGNVVLVIDKLKNQRQQMMQPEGLAAVRDFLYVLTHICRAKEKSKRKIGDGAAVGGADDDDDADELAGLLPTSGASKPAESDKAGGTGGGRGRRPTGPTMEQALQVVEKVLPQIADLSKMLCTIDNTFAKDIDELGRAMCEHFVALTHYAQPQQFWNKYKVSEAKTVATASRLKRTAGSSSSDDDDDDDTQLVAATMPHRPDEDGARPESRASSGRHSRTKKRPSRKRR